jgi:hypothetical protein
MSNRKSLKEWCDWLNKTVRDYSLPEEQWVVVADRGLDSIRVYSGPEPMDRAAAFRLHRRLSRASSSDIVKYHCRKVELRNPDDYRRPDPQ